MVFFNEFPKELHMEYTMELNRLIEMEEGFGEPLFSSIVNY
jgi:Fe-S cluster assembly scaffold protein SufB